jgi:hypothetical protein
MIKKILICLGLALPAAFLAAPVLAAPVFMVSGRNDVLNVDSPLSNNAYLAGSTVNVSKDINGDLVVAGGTIIIDGNIAGDVLAVGGTIEIRGNVAGDIRVLAGILDVKGKVGHDIVGSIGSFTLEKTSTVKGSVVISPNNLYLDGRVNGNVSASFEKGEVSGIIDGDALLRYNKTLTFGSKAKIAGTLTYSTSAQDASFAKVANKVVYQKWIQRHFKPVVFLGIALPFAAFGIWLWKYIGMLVLGGILIWLMPKYLPKIIKRIKENYWAAFWHGFLFLIAVPALMFLGLVVIVGTPLSFLLGVLYVLALIIAALAASLLLASFIMKVDKPKSRQFGGFVVGATVYLLLMLIPVVGWLINFVLMMLALGGVWQEALAGAGRNR